MKILIKEEAVELASKRLSKNATAEKQFNILTARTLEKPFGWIFFYEIITTNERYSETSQNIRPLIINRHSAQVIGNSTEQPIESIIKLYEDLLSQSKAIAEGWCLTFDPAARQGLAFKKLAEKAKKAGFYEIVDEPRDNNLQ
jgi:hypothetical protein